jgi:hypothetical protein
MKTYKQFTEEPGRRPPTFKELIDAVEIIRDGLSGLMDTTDRYQNEVRSIYDDLSDRFDELKEN